ncbi:MAG: biopolymer transporter ExbD [Bacteroidetes bacterium]|nr:MAG: biopolymer transporter ExbD [Bacteroidota bacterium]
MAEIVSNSSSRRLSTHVDMTPMVDLGFLLITFFMLTTTLLQPQVMEIFMPHKGGETMPTKASNTVTLLLGKNNQVHLYRGTLADNPTKELLTYDSNSLRKRLLELKRSIGTAFNTRTNRHEEAMVVVIKAEDKATYKNVIDVLDEINICDINKYALTDISPADLAFMDKKK